MLGIDLWSYDGYCFLSSGTDHSSDFNKFFDNEYDNIINFHFPHYNDDNFD